MSEPDGVTDGDREAAVVRLNAAIEAGHLSIAEFGDRLATAYAAQTPAELVPLVQDLPVPENRQHTVLGSIKRGGRWRLAAYTAISTTVGSVKLDLAGAEMVGREAAVAVRTSLGTIKVWVPADWRVEVYGGSAIGGWRVEENQLPPEVPAPTLRLRLDAFLGTVKVFRV
jgi:hypothetical protein